MKNVRSLCYLVCFFHTQPLLAADTTENATKAIGVSAGLLSGIGFAYRTYAPDEESANHFGGIAYGDDQTLFFNLAYEHLNYLSQFGKSRLAWFSGVSNFFLHDTSETWNLSSVGAGIAFEYGEKKGFNLIFELPLSFGVEYQKIPASSQLDKANSENIKFKMSPIPAGMLLYRF